MAEFSFDSTNELNDQISNGTYISQILVFPPAVPPVTPMKRGLFLISKTLVPDMDRALSFLDGNNCSKNGDGGSENIDGSSY